MPPRTDLRLLRQPPRQPWPWRRSMRPTSPQPRPPSYAEEVMADTPFAWYRFDETEGTTAHDSSGNDRHATYGANVELGLAGPVAGGSAISTFDASGYYVTGPSGLHSATRQEITVEWWRRRVSWGGTYAFDFGYVDGPNQCNVGDAWGGADPGNHMRWVWGNDADEADTDGGCFFPGIAQFNDNIHWYHAVVTGYRAGPRAIWLNGIQRAYREHRTAGTTLASGRNIGRGPLTGRPAAAIAEFAVYDRVLPGDRIRAHYAARNVRP